MARHTISVTAVIDSPAAIAYAVIADYPLVLSTGKKLFSDGFALARLTLAETRALRSGVLVNTYRRSDAG